MDKTQAKEAMRELTLMMLYLSRFSQGEKFHEAKNFYAWKGYDFDILNELDDADYIRQGNHPSRSKSVYITDSGVARAQELLAKYNIDDLAFTKLRSVYRMRTGTELTDSDFVSFELVDENNILTNAGVLLADDSPMRHSRLFCTRWYGLDKASGIMEALDDKEYSGSMVSLLQNGTEFVKNNTKKRWKKTGNGRVEMPEYPEQAVHEVIVNALIHRDYMEIGSEVHIDIFDDRMEVYSPGGMFDGSIVQNLDTDNVASKRRNPVIADIFSRMHFMERRGSGFKKIKADYRHAVNYRPEVEPMFRSTPTSFFATLYNLNYNVPIEKLLITSQKVAVIDEKVSIASSNLSIEDAINRLDAKKNIKENAKKCLRL